jgi:hypothetical protein
MRYPHKRIDRDRHSAQARPKLLVHVFYLILRSSVMPSSLGIEGGPRGVDWQAGRHLRVPLWRFRRRGRRGREVGDHSMGSPLDFWLKLRGGYDCRWLRGSRGVSCRSRRDGAIDGHRSASGNDYPAIDAFIREAYEDLAPYKAHDAGAGGSSTIRSASAARHRRCGSRSRATGSWGRSPSSAAD